MCSTSTCYAKQVNQSCRKRAIGGGKERVALGERGQEGARGRDGGRGVGVEVGRWGLQGGSGCRVSHKQSQFVVVLCKAGMQAISGTAEQTGADVDRTNLLRFLGSHAYVLLERLKAWHDQDGICKTCWDSNATIGTVTLHQQS